MKGVPLPFPYLPQLIQLAVLTSILALFGVLFITIGVVTQAAWVFLGLILDTQKHLREGSTVERSAQAISIGIYSLLFLPFWMIQLPFSHCRVNLEFASSQRSSHGRSSSLHRLRRYPVFAPSDQVLAFVLSKVAPANSSSRPDTRDMLGAGLSHVGHFNVLLGICRTWPLVWSTT